MEIEKPPEAHGSAKREGARRGLVLVHTRWLDASFCGADHDLRFLARLPEGVCPCGEGGEFHSFGFDAGGWARLVGVACEGYEIRHGRSALVDGAADTRVALRDDAGEAIGWQRGSVLGLYLHGLFESPAVPHALFGHAPRTLDTVFDGLADFIDSHFGPGALMRLALP